ncbi:MAG: phosphoribosyltransferase [Salinarimonadaceae bacterium]|nr:MAG: phosphoribosyltransferase [Salinarimonadaceae bacterium]
MAQQFHDRRDAGEALAARLARLNLPDPVALALPRGGVPVAAAIGQRLNAPLDMIFVRKIGVPMNPEFAAAAFVDLGAGEIVTNPGALSLPGVTQEYLEAEAARARAEIDRRRGLYFPAGFESPSLAGKSAIVVDDGIATGASMRAALLALRRAAPARIVVAVPVAPSDFVARLAREVDDVVCLQSLDDFGAVGAFYNDFRQLSDEDVVAIMREHVRPSSPAPQPRR